MGKRIVNVLTVCIVLLFALSSCSLDSALDALSGNVYGKLGVKFDNPAADATKETIDNTKVAKNEEAIDDSNNSVDIAKLDGFADLAGAIDGLLETGVSDENGNLTSLSISISSELAKNIQTDGLLSPMGSDAKNEFNTNIANTLLNSDPSVKEEFVSYLGENAAVNKSNAAKNSLNLADTLLDSAMDHIPDSIPADLKNTITSIQESIKAVAAKDTALTNAELTQVQMVTNMVTSVTNVIVEYGKQTGEEEQIPDLSQPPYSDAIDDLTVLSQVSAEMSSAGVSSLSIPDVSSIISSLQGMFTGGSSSGDDGSSSES